jgi:hypothetical protein
MVQGLHTFGPAGLRPKVNQWRFQQADFFGLYSCFHVYKPQPFEGIPDAQISIPSKLTVFMPPSSVAVRRVRVVSRTPAGAREDTSRSWLARKNDSGTRLAWENARLDRRNRSGSGLDREQRNRRRGTNRVSHSSYCLLKDSLKIRW